MILYHYYFFIILDMMKDQFVKNMVHIHTQFVASLILGLQLMLVQDKGEVN